MKILHPVGTSFNVGSGGRGAGNVDVGRRRGTFPRDTTERKTPVAGLLRNLIEPLSYLIPSRKLSVSVAAITRAREPPALSCPRARTGDRVTRVKTRSLAVQNGLSLSLRRLLRAEIEPLPRYPINRDRFPFRAFSSSFTPFSSSFSFFCHSPRSVVCFCSAVIAHRLRRASLISNL